MHGEDEREQQAEKRAGERHDDLIERAKSAAASARSMSALPSMMSIGASCGSATNPPKGSEPSEYWTPLIVFFQSGLPNQMPNFSM